MTITVEDEDGLSTDCTFTLTVVDDEDPTITDCPVSATVIVDASCTYTLPDYTTGVTVEDNCTATVDLIITQVPSAGTVLSGDGTSQLVTITVADANGNTDDCTFTLTLDDDTAPAIATCPSDVMTAGYSICI